MIGVNIDHKPVSTSPNTQPDASFLAEANDDFSDNGYPINENL